MKKFVALDTETTGLHPYGTIEDWGFWPARPFAFSWCFEDGETGYQRFEVDPKTRRVIYTKRGRKIVQEVLDEADVKIFHNANFDLKMSIFSGFDPSGQVIDTQILAHAVTGGGELVYGLKDLSVKHLGYPKDDETELEEDAKRARNCAPPGTIIASKEFHGPKPYKADYWLAKPELCERYARGDVERTMLLFQLWWNTAMENPNLAELIDREHRVMATVLRLELNGMAIFLEDLVRLKEFYTSYSIHHRNALKELGFGNLNARSGPQKKAVFVDHFGIQPLRYTKTGKPSMDGDFLKYCAEDLENPVARAVLEDMNAKYALSTYCNVYENVYVSEENGLSVIHPNIRQSGTRTGRISGSDPNMLNIPSEDTGRKRSIVGLKIRECFGPRPGHIWYLPDYSQLEVWIFAAFAESESMLEALSSGEDYHGSIARQVWGGEKDFKERFSYYRKCAKLVMFCKLYGGGAKKVAFLLHTSLQEAERFVAMFDAKLPDVIRFMRRTINQARKEGCVVNPYGRVTTVDAGYEYRAVNYRVQGTAADIVKCAMLEVDTVLQAWPGSETILQIHDELILEIPLKHHSKKLMREIIAAMQEPTRRLGLPYLLPVTMKTASARWSKTRELCGKHQLRHRCECAKPAPVLTPVRISGDQV